MKPLLFNLSGGLDTFDALVRLTVGQYFTYNVDYTVEHRPQWVIHTGRGVERTLVIELSAPGRIGIILEGETKAVVNQMNPDSLKEEYSILEFLRELNNVIFGKG